MNGGLAGLAIGIPLGLASVAIAWMMVRAMLQAADKPGWSPTVIPVVILVGVAMVLYACNPETLAPLGDLAGVGLGGLVGLLVGRAAAPEQTTPGAVLRESEPVQLHPLDRPPRAPVDVDVEEEVSMRDPEGVGSDGQVDDLGR